MTRWLKHAHFKSIQCGLEWEDEKLRRKEERDDACYLVCTFDEMNENFTCYEKVTFLHRLEVFMLI